MYKIDIPGNMKINIALFLQFLEYFQVVCRDVGQGRKAERRTSPGNIPPGAPAVMNYQNRVKPFLCQVPEQGTTGNASPGYENICFFIFFTIIHTPGKDDFLWPAIRVQFSHLHQVCHGAPGCQIRYDLYPVVSQGLHSPWQAARSAAGPHSHTGDVLELVCRYRIPVPNELEQIFEGNVLAVTQVCFNFFPFFYGLHIGKPGIVFLHYESANFQ